MLSENAEAGTLYIMTPVSTQIRVAEVDDEVYELRMLSRVAFQAMICSLRNYQIA